MSESQARRPDIAINALKHVLEDATACVTPDGAEQFMVASAWRHRGRQTDRVDSGTEMAMPTELDDLWRQKTDEQLVDAFLCLSEYCDEGQRVIRAEFTRRHLAEPAPTMLSIGQIETVAKLQRRFVGLVAAEWLSLVAIIVAGALFPYSIGSAVAFVGVSVFIGARVALPFTAYKLLTCLEIESPRGTAVLMQIPLFSLLILVGLRSLTDRWSRMHGIEVGLLGPTRRSLAQLHQARSR